MSSLAAEEDMIHRRLLIEGDTGGDDKRLIQMQKLFWKLTDTAALKEDDNMESFVDDTATKIECALNQAETGVRRCSAICDMNQQAVENYNRDLEEIEKEIMKAKSMVDTQKDLLESAKVVRRHKQAFDSLAQTILKEPTRSLSEKRLEAIRAEMAQLKESEAELDGEQKDIDRHFKLFTFALAQLKSHLDQKGSEASEAGANGQSKQNDDDDEVMEISVVNK